ncbi:MAG: OmpA family protein, partial [Acidimicrobiales bacterium]
MAAGPALSGLGVAPVAAGAPPAGAPPDGAPPAGAPPAGAPPAYSVPEGFASVGPGSAKTAPPAAGPGSA